MASKVVAFLVLAFLLLAVAFPFPVVRKLAALASQESGILHLCTYNKACALIGRFAPLLSLVCGRSRRRAAAATAAAEEAAMAVAT